MKRKSIAIVLISLFAVLLFSACAGPRLVRDLSAVYAANVETTVRPELADRQDLAEYQATLPHIVLSEYTAPTSQIAPLMLNDRQELADYQLFLSNGYVE